VLKGKTVEGRNAPLRSARSFLGLKRNHVCWYGLTVVVNFDFVASLDDVTVGDDVTIGGNGEPCAGRRRNRLIGVRLFWS